MDYKSPDVNAHPCIGILKDFFSLMHEWEAEALAHHESIDWGNTDSDTIKLGLAEQRKKAALIFDRFCEVGSRAELFQDAGIAISDPPRYNPEDELVVSVLEKPGKVVVETRQSTGANWHFKYELVAIDSSWRIRDYRRRCSDYNPVWKKDIL